MKLLETAAPDAKSDKVVQAADGWLVSAVSNPVRNGGDTSSSISGKLRNC